MAERCEKGILDRYDIGRTRLVVERGQLAEIAAGGHLVEGDFAPRKRKVDHPYAPGRDEIGIGTVALAVDNDLLALDIAPCATLLQIFQVAGRYGSQNFDARERLSARISHGASLMLLPTFE